LPVGLSPDKQWLYGQVISTGQFGWLPAKYVVVAS
jgi:hypothetical protein